MKINNNQIEDFVESLFQEHAMSLLNKYGIEEKQLSGFTESNHLNYVNFKHAFFSKEQIEMHYSLIAT